ncbi:Zinc-containing alcohol dehydrogenase [Trichoderma guizhouense]|uniref:Zinc-containing alcohol dehydrogenase n=1 Tax=Trichoderma guizhouense TaxID=1491466 RepID=A0A1T3C9E1_9HYPO|nr:Zinc-containing alcohol dehydrogenase [Trichoderma guizhouense]
MASNDNKFEGWVALDKNAAEGQMVWQTYEPKAWEETDIDIQITHCGICGTDIHQLRSGWGETAYPVVVGHELVGITVRVGKEAAKTGIKVGDRVGVGAQNDSCQCRKPPQIREDHSDCDACATGNEVYCPNMTLTYGAQYLTPAGGKSMGGYARYHRCPAAFAFKIPDQLASEHAAPMMCAGLTVFSPLAHFGARGNDQGPLEQRLKGMNVGVIGIGGVGHFALLFAKAMGADRVMALSRRADKRKDALALGADEYIATAEDEGWEKKYASSLDLILCAVSSSNMPLTDYINLLKRDGTFCQLGLPDDGLFRVGAGPIASQRRKLTGSFMGSPHEIRAMLQLAADKGIKPWVEQWPMSEANRAIVDMEKGKAKYRYVLANDHQV